MKNANKNRDPERAQKRALANARCAWRKMGTDSRAEFVRFMVENDKEERGQPGTARSTDLEDAMVEGSGLRVWFSWMNLEGGA